MSLSDICSQQYQREQQKLRQILLWGLLGSVGVHAVALGLGQLNLWQAATEQVSPIELIVTEAIPAEPETLPQPEQPAELSTATNNPAPAAASASPRPAAVIAPPAPASAPAATPDIPEPDTQAESALEETVEEEAEAAAEEAVEEIEAAEEAIAPEPDTPAASQSDRLRDLLQRLRESQVDGGTSAAVAPTGSATAGSGVAPNAPAGDRPGVAAAPSSGSGTGSSSGQGSRTVACQTCVRPSYPQSALESGVEGQPVVSVDINPDGSVRSVTLTRSSGNPAIDQAAIQAARNSRFQPVAGGASVPIEYDLTIEGSRRNRDARRRGDRQTVELPPEPTPATAATEPGPAPSDTPPAAPAAPAEPAAVEPAPPEAGSGSGDPGFGAPEPAPEPAPPPVSPPPVPAPGLAAPSAPPPAASPPPVTPAAAPPAPAAPPVPPEAPIAE